ncbi:MAG TPA: glycosyltransferase family 4 protein [Gemmataceae bacterium]|nr:glycosyltransferase family 4 protein [Gemmataceae bacterium]
MRICLYTETALPKMGGQEMAVDALARQFLNLGHEPIVLAPLPRWPLRPNDSTLPYPVIRHWRFFSTRYLVSWYRWFICRLHRQIDIDVLHCHGIYPPAYLAGLSRDKLKIPVVVTSHGGDVNPDNVRLAKPILRERHSEGLRSADALIAISRCTRDGLRRLCPGAANIVDIPNGVNLEPFAETAPAPDDLDPAIKAGKYLLFLGRLSRGKGVDVLLEALSQVRPSGGVDLVIAGNGDVRGELEKQCRELNLHERVRFVGQVTGSKKTYLLQNAISAVVPSRAWEAFGLVVLESYAAGKPVIASDLPGLADNVHHGRTGFLVPPKDPEALAKRLQQALTAPHSMQQMARATRQLVSKYTWHSVAKQHLELYKKLLAGETSQQRMAA